MLLVVVQFLNIKKDPILPGKTAKIKVQYNAANGGQFDKTVYVKLAGVDEENGDADALGGYGQ